MLTQGGSQDFAPDEVVEIRLLVSILVLRWLEACKASAVKRDEEDADARTCPTVETSFANFLHLVSNKHCFSSAAINRFRQRAFVVMESFSGDRESSSSSSSAFSDSSSL